MVTDFRSLGLGSLSEAREGEKISEAEQQRRNKECMKKESMEAKGLEYVNAAQESAEVQAQRAVIQALEDKFEVKGSKLNFLFFSWLTKFRFYFNQTRRFTPSPQKTVMQHHLPLPCVAR